MKQYNQHLGYANSSDHMANSYSMSLRTFKWTTKLFFHLLDLTVLNIWILFSSCGAKYTHCDVRLLLVRYLIEEAGKSQDCPTPRLVGRPSADATNVVLLKSHHNQHWPAKSSTQLHCHLCSSRGQRKGTVYKCARCDMGLCVVPCFAEYHTRVNFKSPHTVLLWSDSDPSCRRPSGATRIMWAVGYLHHILYNTCNLQA